jgi:hypothetical protein
MGMKDQGDKTDARNTGNNSPVPNVVPAGK